MSTDKKKPTLRAVLGGKGVSSSEPPDDDWDTATPEPPAEEADERFAMKKNGGHMGTPGNAFLFLRSCPDHWSLWFDEEREVAMVERSFSVGKVARPGELDDYVVEAAQQWLGSRFGLEIGIESTAKALVRLARQTCRRPVEEYLKGLEWDGVHRLASVATGYFGAIGTEENLDRANALTRLWLISAVARAMQPGCQADYMLILVGPQGARKTSAFTVLAGKWMQPSLPDLRDKDSQQALVGAWIVCLDELSTFKRASSAETAKDFLTRRVDRYRPSYGRSYISKARRCVFSGTTNDDSFLTDDTGSRRFWCVRTKFTDTAALERDRDQIWAEAMGEYLDGKQWWPDKRLESESQKANESFSANDEWEKAVLEFVEGKNQVTVSAILKCLGLDEKDHGQKEQNRVARIIKPHGWKRVRRSGIGGIRYWAYEREIEDERKEEAGKGVDTSDNGDTW